MPSRCNLASRGQIGFGQTQGFTLDRQRGASALAALTVNQPVAASLA
ncbi:MAG: hypothetical protein R3F53_05705 [Gammaproteobacteria bacterium]